MKHNILLFIFILISLGMITDQSQLTKKKFIKFSFECHNRLDSILLPSDFHGPNYFHYEEGSIISFTSRDTCVVSILCGANAVLNLDSTYVKIEPMKETLDKRHLVFYSSRKNRFGRQDYMKRYFIMYENASKCRKEDLDRTFDSLMKE